MSTLDVVIFSLSGLTLTISVYRISLIKNDLSDTHLKYKAGLRHFNMTTSFIDYFNPLIAVYFFLRIPSVKKNPDFYAMNQIQDKYKKLVLSRKLAALGLAGILIATYIIPLLDSWMANYAP